MSTRKGDSVPAGEMDFRILDAGSAADLSVWRAAWDAWPQREVQAHPCYVGLFTDAGARAKCAMLSGPGGTVLYPFVHRMLGFEPPLCGAGEGLSDITSPYGYAGPFCWGVARRHELAKAFWRCFDEWAASQSVVSEFIRFGLFPDHQLPYAGDVAFKQWNIIRDLAVDPPDLWMDFEHKVRKNVAKARRCGVAITVDPEGARFPDFYEIYISTMRRRNASRGYYFPKAFFSRIQRDLAGHFAYFHAARGGQVISSELVLLSSDSVYSFLGGTESEAFPFRPNDLLKYHVMVWARDMGKRWLILGGGYGGEDGIFSYKRSFAPGGCVPFQVGTRVLDPRRYKALVRHRRAQDPDWAPQTGYFPEYRG